MFLVGFTLAPIGKWQIISLIRYFIHERCNCSLYQYIKEKNSYQGPPLPDDRQCLTGLASALAHIHSVGYAHRDIAPANILIWTSPNGNGVLKITDFGLCREVSETGSHPLSEKTYEAVYGHSMYMAPELLQMENRRKGEGSIDADTFSMGCVFFFFLTKGQHPFQGESIYHIPINIMKGKFDLTNLREDHFGYNLMKKMIQLDAKQRPKMKDVEKYLKEHSLSQLEAILKNQTTTNTVLNRAAAFESSVSLVSMSTFTFQESSVGNLQVLSFSFHPTKPILACGQHDKRIHLFHTNFSSQPFSQLENISTSNKSNDAICQLSWNKKGTKLAVGLNNGQLIIFHVDGNMTTHFKQKEHSKAITVIKWNWRVQGIELLISGGRNGKICIWDSTKGLVLKLKDHSSVVVDVVWLSDSVFASFHEDHTLRIYRMLPSTCKTIFNSAERNDTSVECPRWNEDLQALTWASRNVIKMFSLKDHTVTQQLEMSSPIKSYDYFHSPTGQSLIAIGLDEQGVEIRNQDGTQLIRTLNTPSPPRLLIGRLLFSPNGQLLASITRRNLIIWSTQTGQIVYQKKIDDFFSDEVHWESTSQKIAIRGLKFHVFEKK